MKTIISCLIISLLLCTQVFAEFRITKDNLLQAYEIPASHSPNGEYGLFLINRGITTSTFVGFMSTSRERLLGVSSIWPQGLNPDRYKKYATILWSRNSKYVALHDSSILHSKLHVFKIFDTTIEEIAIPDLVEFVSIDNPSILKAKSSGQLPIKWLNNSELEISIRYINSNGINKKVGIVLNVLSGKPTEYKQ